MLIWIVGSEGLLGRELVTLCSDLGLPYLATDRKECDITDYQMCFTFATLQKPTHIINCAAFTDVDGAESCSIAAQLVNAEGPLHLAMVAEMASAKLIHISTDYVFDGMATTPYKEDAPGGPINVYGKTKWEGEQNILQHSPHACIIRTSWLFGLSGKNFLSSLMHLLEQNEKVRIVHDQINKPTYVVDLAGAILELLEHEGIFHFANGEPMNRYQIAQDVLKQLPEAKCRHIEPVDSSAFPMPAPRPRFTALDTTKYTQTIAAPRSWEEILTDYLGVLNAV